MSIEIGGFFKYNNFSAVLGLLSLKLAGSPRVLRDPFHPIFFVKVRFYSYSKVKRHSRMGRIIRWSEVPISRAMKHVNCVERSSKRFEIPLIRRALDHQRASCLLEISQLDPEIDLPVLVAIDCVVVCLCGVAEVREVVGVSEAANEESFSGGGEERLSSSPPRASLRNPSHLAKMGGGSRLQPE